MCSIKKPLLFLLVYCTIAAAQGTGADQTDSTMAVDSTVSAASLTNDSLLRDSGLSATAKRSSDTNANAIANDSAAGRPSDGERMYRSVIPVMRRDEPTIGKAPDTSARAKQEKHPEPMMAPPPKPPAVDSFLVLPGARQASSGPKTHLQKRSVLIVLGACAVVGGAVAFYLIKNSQDKSAADINNRIPPPPDPPVGGLSP
jgi:hypothetical protein